ncbi:MAG: type II secretion system major pseudopilin GspG [Bdellovibrionales bacterium]
MKMNQSGMTLIEIMIVLAILGGLMFVLVPNVMDAFTKAKVQQSIIQLNNIKQALQSYSVDCGKLPSEELGLQALTLDPGQSHCQQWGPRPYLKDKQLEDRFGHDFVYEVTSEATTLTFLGRDGRPGGKGFDADVMIDDID